MSKSKILSIVALVLGLIGVLLFIMVLTADQELGSKSMDSAAGRMVGYGYVLLIITAIVAVVASVISLVKNPEGLKKFVRNILIMAVILAISYFMASDGEVTDVLGNVLKDGEAGTISKWVSTLINFTTILFVLGILAIGGGFVRSLIKK